MRGKNGTACAFQKNRPACDRAVTLLISWLFLVANVYTLTTLSAVSGVRARNLSVTEV
jgi:hypothetical protein